MTEVTRFATLKEQSPATVQVLRVTTKSGSRYLVGLVGSGGARTVVLRGRAKDGSKIEIQDPYGALEDGSSLFAVNPEYWVGMGLDVGSLSTSRIVAVEGVDARDGAEDLREAVSSLHSLRPDGERLETRVVAVPEPGRPQAEGATPGEASHASGKGVGDAASEPGTPSPSVATATSSGAGPGGGAASASQGHQPSHSKGAAPPQIGTAAAVASATVAGASVASPGPVAGAPDVARSAVSGASAAASSRGAPGPVAVPSGPASPTPPTSSGPSSPSGAASAVGGTSSVGASREEASRSSTRHAVPLLVSEPVTGPLYLSLQPPEERPIKPLLEIKVTELEYAAAYLRRLVRAGDDVLTGITEDPELSPRFEAAFGACTRWLQALSRGILESVSEDEGGEEVGDDDSA